MQGDLKTQHEAQEDCRVSPGQVQAPQKEDPQSIQATPGNANSCQALAVTDSNFSWEPKASYSKAFLGQRKKSIRDSLDWDFQNEMPMANTRRSKDYGEQARGAGRS